MFSPITHLAAVAVSYTLTPERIAAFEIDGDVIRTLYVVRNPDKLRHLATRGLH